MAIKKTDSAAEEAIVSLTTDTAPPHTDLENDLDSNPSEGAMETTTVSEQISQTESDDDSLSAAGIKGAFSVCPASAAGCSGVSTAVSLFLPLNLAFLRSLISVMILR